MLIDHRCSFEVPVYAQGFSEMKQALDEAMGGNVAPLMLASSAKLNSNILWPPSVRGKELYRWVAAKPRNWWERLFGTDRTDGHLTDAARSVLERSN